LLSSGGFTPEIAAMVKAAGYNGAVTTNRGKKDKFNRDFFAIRRVHMKDHDSDLVMWAKLTGYYNAFRKGKDGINMAASQYHLNADGSFSLKIFSMPKLLPIFFLGWRFIRHSMWAFYVNRGQGIASFGIESKDRAILEFQPANKAYRLASTQGFRTFLKISGGKSLKFYEPFANHIQSPFKITARMAIQSHDLTIEEVNATLGIKTTINYLLCRKNICGFGAPGAHRKYFKEQCVH